MTEPYVTARGLANIMGVHPSTVKRWKRKGMPYERWGIKAVRFLPSECMEWARGQDDE